jgi:pimeloyl-ACP methyl ester carboxylesterase
MTSPRRHSISVPNTFSAAGKHELVFFDYGDVNAHRTVICVHGLTRNAHDFDILAHALAATGRRVFTLNMAGRGESPWLADPMGYNYGSYVADCLAILDNFHLRGVEWIGTSMGGIIGMMLAAGNPGRIRKLILNDIGIHLGAHAFKRIIDYVSTLPSSFPDRATASTYLHQVYEPFGITDPVQWSQFVDASLMTDASGTLRYACDPAIIEPIRLATQNFTEIHDVNLTDIWEQIDIPTYVLHGADSDVLTADTVKSMRIANSRMESVTIQGVGHAPSLMSAEQVALVVNWLTRPTAGMLAAGL